MGLSRYLGDPFPGLDLEDTTIITNSSRVEDESGMTVTGLMRVFMSTYMRSSTTSKGCGIRTMCVTEACECSVRVSIRRDNFSSVPCPLW